MMKIIGFLGNFVMVGVRIKRMECLLCVEIRSTRSRGLSF